MFFFAAVQQIRRQHGHRQREEQAFHGHNGLDRRARNGQIGHDRTDEAGNAAQHKDAEESQKEALAPAVGPGHDGDEPKSHHTEQQRRANDEEVEKIDPADHASTPPAENGMRSFFSCSFTLSEVIGLSMKPRASVFHASREYSG